jgi:hypothetical protein
LFFGRAIGQGRTEKTLPEQTERLKKLSEREHLKAAEYVKLLAERKRLEAAVEKTMAEAKAMNDENKRLREALKRYRGDGRGSCAADGARPTIRTPCVAPFSDACLRGPLWFPVPSLKKLYARASRRDLLEGGWYGGTRTCPGHD